MNRNKLIKRAASVIAAAAIAISALSATVFAGETYQNYSYDRFGDPIPSQAGYVAERFVDGKTIGCGDLYEPADLFIDSEDIMYIADKKNNRIIATDLDFQLLKIYDTFDYNGETLTLKTPQGIFVDDNTGFMYICDSENDRVIKCDKNGKVQRLFTKPTSPLYGDDITYQPYKVCVDESGNVYVVVKSVNRGAVMFDQKGEFLGFYGANTVLATAEVIANAFWNLISTEEQMMRSAKSTPVGFSNFDIQGQFVYTVTETTTTTADQLKKLNPRGDNVLDAIEMQGENFGDISPAYYSVYAKDSSMVDVDIGDNGEMSLLDFVHGRVHQFDKDGYRLFIMGGTGDKLGQFRSAVALETRADKVYVLDSRKATITIFKQTPFGELVSNASQYFNRAEYADSRGMWEDVLKYDGNYRRAYIGLGLADLFDKNYEGAMSYFRISLSRYYYGQAYEGYRNQFLKEHFAVIIILIVVAIAAIWGYRAYRRRHPKNRERRV